MYDMYKLYREFNGEGKEYKGIKFVFCFLFLLLLFVFILYSLFFVRIYLLEKWRNKNHIYSGGANKSKCSLNLLLSRIRLCRSVSITPIDKSNCLLF